MSQLKKKFIENNAVDGSKILLLNNEMLRARNAANSADVNILRVNSADNIELQKLPEAAAALPVPSALKQFATVEYIQNFVNGKGDVKDAVQAISDSNIPLTGATPLVADGVTMANGMRLGLAGQTTGSQNGIYDVAITGGTYTLTRSADANSSTSVTNGMNFVSTGGTNYAGFEALLTTPDPITLGTTSLTFVLYPTTISQIAGDMLAKSGNTWTVDLLANGGLESSNAGNVAGQLKVRPDSAALEKDQTTRIGSTGVVAKKSKKSVFTLSASDITNQYLDLPDVAGDASVQLEVAGAGSQFETIDYTVNYTGGVSSKTRITFAGGLATAGVSALAAGDVVVISYKSF